MSKQIEALTEVLQAGCLSQCGSTVTFEAATPADASLLIDTLIDTPTIAAQIEAQSAIDLIDNWMRDRQIALPISDIGNLAKRLEAWRTPTIVTALRQAEGGDRADSRIYPSLELCVLFSEDGRHIRKWSRLPFDGGTPLYSQPSPEPLRQAEAAPGVVEATLEATLRSEALAMREAVSGIDTPGCFHRLNWEDKPHRVLFDACTLMEQAADALARQHGAREQ